MGTTGCSMEVAAVFPLRLSLAPLRLAEAKDKVPCLKLIERCALVDLCGVIMVVVR